MWISRFSSIVTPPNCGGRGAGPDLLGLSDGPDVGCLGCPASRWWRRCSAPLGGPLLFYLGMGVWLSRDWMALMAVVPGRGH